MHCCISCGTNQAKKGQARCDYPTPIPLRTRWTSCAITCNEDALALLEQAVTKARDNRVYAKQLEETLLQGSTVEIRECLSCFGDYFERSRDAPPYYQYHDAVNGIDCVLYSILFGAAHPDAELTHE